jgi:hypothetical protein
VRSVTAPSRSRIVSADELRGSTVPAMRTAWSTEPPGLPRRSSTTPRAPCRAAVASAPATSCAAVSGKPVMGTYATPRSTTT